MAIALDALLGQAANDSAGASISLVTGAVVAAGARVFVVGSGYHSPQTVTASGGGLTWTTDYSVGSTNWHLFVCSADAPAGLASGTTLTLTYSPSTDGANSIFAASFTGVTGTLDGSAGTVAGASGTAWDSGAITTTNADDLIVGVGFGQNSGASSTQTSGAGLSEIGDLADAGGSGHAAVYRIVASTGSYKANGTWSATASPNGGAVVAYKATAVVPPSSASGPAPPATFTPHLSPRAWF